MAEPTRGERNRNPGNLRYNPRIAWLGEDDPPQDPGGYCRFTDDFHGLRALAMDLYHKWARGLRTVEAIIAVYAPPAENDTAAYVKDVCQQLAVKPAELIDLSLAGNVAVLAKAVIRHENGRCIYGNDLIARAVTAALPHEITGA